MTTSILDAEAAVLREFLKCANASNQGNPPTNDPLEYLKADGEFLLEFYTDTHIPHDWHFNYQEYTYIFLFRYKDDTYRATWGTHYEGGSCSHCDDVIAEVEDFNNDRLAGKHIDPGIVKFDTFEKVAENTKET